MAARRASLLAPFDGVVVEGDHLVIRRGRPKLADLLARCKPENRPDPIDFGPPVGREII